MRLKSWVYSTNGYYFITICTKEKEYYFGKIRDQNVILNEIGKIVKQYWLEIPEHIKYVEIDEFIIMPNHIHGIIINNHQLNTSGSFDVGSSFDACIEATAADTNVKDITNMSPKRGELPVVIRSFKSAVTNWCNKNNLIFAWQRGYYDRIIRNDEELYNVRNYIKYNPLKWNEDEYFNNVRHNVET